MSNEDDDPYSSDDDDSTMMELDDSSFDEFAKIVEEFSSLQPKNKIPIIRQNNTFRINFSNYLEYK